MNRVSMRTITCAICLLAAWPAGGALANDHHDTTVVIRWNQAVLQAVPETRMPPPQVARALAIVHTA